METIQLVQPQQEFKDFMSMPDGLAKNVSYYNNMYSKAFTEASITKKDGCIYYSAKLHSKVKTFVEELNKQVQRDSVLKEPIDQYVQVENNIVNEYLPF